MQLFGLNWQLQELDNQPAFENGAVGKTGPTQTVVTALAADGEGVKPLTSEVQTHTLLQSQFTCICD